MRNFLFTFGLVAIGTLVANGQDTITVYEYLSPGGTTQLDAFKGFPNQTAAQAEIDRVVSLFGGSIYIVTDPCNATRSPNFANPCHADAACTKAADSLVQCSCNSGYSQTTGGKQFAGTVVEPDGTNCQDNNECVTSPPTECGSATATCTNLPGTYTCTCVSGYQLDSSLLCIDIDECGASTDNCDGNAICTNTAGSFACSCDVGYIGNGTTCTDFDQCSAIGYDCGPNGVCNDTVGGYFCTCNTGYTANTAVDPNTCDDVDECATGGNNCPGTASCTNTAGSFTCSCNVGYTGDGTSCVDVDECATGRDNCPGTASCTNTAGSFTCSCNVGYTGDGTSCVDVDECATGRDNCPGTASCTNTAGSFICSCNVGYTGDGTTCVASSALICDQVCIICGSRHTASHPHTCNDVNECTSSGSNNCDANATCTNTVGGFTCACDTGYSGDGVTCADIDECASSPCSSNAKCSNTDGSFTCSCNIGFFGNGFSCANFDECLSAPCSLDATCTSNGNSFKCSCKSGFVGDGMTCTDLNECANPTSICDENADCANEHGSFVCSCRSGFVGNGFTCTRTGEQQELRKKFWKTVIPSFLLSFFQLLADQSRTLIS